MAVQFDAVGPSSAGAGVTTATSGPISWSHVVSGANRLIVAYFCTDNLANSNASATCTQGGSPVAMTPFSASPQKSGGLNAGQLYAWYMIAPDTGTVTLSVSWTGSAAQAHGGSISFTGADQVKGITNVVTNNDGSGTLVTSGSLVFPSTTSGNMCVVGITEGSDSGIFTSGTSRFMSGWGGGGGAAGQCGGATSPSTGSAVSVGWNMANDVFAAIGAEVVAQSVSAPGPAASLPSDVWQNRFGPLSHSSRRSVLWDIQPVFRGVFVTAGDVAFGANTSGQFVFIVTDPGRAMPGPAFLNAGFYNAYLSKQAVRFDRQPAGQANVSANVAFGATTHGSSLFLNGDRSSIDPGQAWSNYFRAFVNSQKHSVLFDRQLVIAQSYIDSSDIAFGAVTLGNAQFTGGLPANPNARVSPAFRNRFKGSHSKLSVQYDNPPDRIEIPFGPFCLGGTETDSNLYGGTATEANPNYGGTQTETNTYGGAFAGCYV